MKSEHKTKIRVPYLFLSCLFVFIFLKNSAQEEKKGRPIELSAGYGMLIYQSGYGLKNLYGVEIVAGKHLNEILKAEGGIRIGLKPRQPDLFIRLSATNRFDHWKPLFGIESGYSNRMYFEGSSNLLKETREAMTNDLGHFYLSSHTEILSFEFKNQWDISLLELDFGTHFKDFGTTVRFQTNFIRIRKTL
jgi:hypothetical protein